MLCMETVYSLHSYMAWQAGLPSQAFLPACKPSRSSVPLKPSRSLMACLLTCWPPCTVQNTRCCTKHPLLYKTSAAIQNVRCYTKHPLLYKTSAAIQNTRCCTKHPLLYKTPAAVQNTRCYTNHPSLYKIPSGFDGNQKRL